MGKRKNARTGKKVALFALCLTLVLVALFGGYAFANYIKGRHNSGGNEASHNNVANPAQNGNNPWNENNIPGNGAANSGTDRDGSASTPVLSRMPVEVIYDVDFETGWIEEILIGILRTGEGKLDYIRIDTDVMYTMSANLYTSLTPDNTTLPQTVTFSELYRYYRNDKAFDAGRRIIGEMLSLDILYYSAMPDHDFEKLFSIEKYSEGIDTEFAIRPSTAKNDHGTDGSVKGFISEVLKETLTNWSIDERLRYLETLDDLESEDVTFTDAPVIVRNESCSLDTDAVGRILYEILY